MISPLKVLNISRELFHILGKLFLLHSTQQKTLEDQRRCISQFESIRPLLENAISFAIESSNLSSSSSSHVALETLKTEYRKMERSMSEKIEQEKTHHRHMIQQLAELKSQQIETQKKREYSSKKIESYERKLNQHRKKANQVTTEINSKMMAEQKFQRSLGGSTAEAQKFVKFVATSHQKVKDSYRTLREQDDAKSRELSGAHISAVISHISLQVNLMEHLQSMAQSGFNLHELGFDVNVCFFESDLFSASVYELLSSIDKEQEIVDSQIKHQVELVKQKLAEKLEIQTSLQQTLLTTKTQK